MRQSAWLIHVLLLAASCRGATTPPDLPSSDDPVAPAPDALSAVDQLVRASMTLRGLRPRGADVEAVLADPAQLSAIVAAYADDPAFGAVVRDMHHEQLLMRSERVILPSLGPVEGSTDVEVNQAIVEEPLALIEEVVTSGEPYTAVVTADYTMANAISAELWGHPFDPAGPDWQRAPLADERPGAGVLSTSGLWVRHPSNGRNHHRQRAALLAKTLLCFDFLAADVPIDGSVDLTNDDAVANALDTNPSCIACHQNLDPLASALWGFREVMSPASVVYAYANDCIVNERRGGSDCYPIALWNRQATGTWRALGLRAPGLFGEPVANLGELGAAIAAHPAFASCTVRRFAGYFAQERPEDVEDAWVDAFTADFVASGYDARQLAVDLVLSPTFLGDEATGDAVGLLTVRPEQYASLIEDLTGFTWNLQNGRSGVRDLGRTDRWGYRNMSGGVDGITVTAPTHQMTPVKALTLSAFATEAAAWVVREDLASRADPRLLRVAAANPGATDEATVRAQLAALFLDVLATPAAADGSDVSAAYSLFADALADHGDLDLAWTLTLSALLQDPRLLHY